MKLQSCSNCWFNGLQYGSVGLSLGFCARHHKVLKLSDETTCGQHVRKDLGFARAQDVSRIHARTFRDDKIVRLIDNREALSDVSESKGDADLLRRDAVAEAVLNYGSLNTTIVSLAQLKVLETARADLAMTSLGRAYTRNCALRGGAWTSGIHLYWWTKKRIAVIPYFRIEDIRYSGATSLPRQAELAAWSVMMLRLTLMDDIIEYARQQNDPLGEAGSLSRRAASAVGDLSVRKLSFWIKRKLLPALESYLDYDRYASIALELHKDLPGTEENA